MPFESDGIRRVHQLLIDVERGLREKGNITGPIKLSPWLTVSNLPRFLENMRNEIQEVEQGKGPIGYPITTAVWEDLVKKLEILRQVLAASPSVHHNGHSNSA
ncbi:MAG TPA: hypothetical protein PLQ35_14915 [bacterium]|nr:hypothetical protein [bacterium]HQL63576.1 hypothetical protein [bacterium]